MAYSKENRLQRIIDIQELYMKHSKNHEGCASDAWIYENLVKPVYRISLRTFYTYLGTNAKREIKELQKDTVQDNRQKTLPFKI